MKITPALRGKRLLIKLVDRGGIAEGRLFEISASGKYGHFFDNESVFSDLGGWYELETLELLEVLDPITNPG